MTELNQAETPPMGLPADDKIKRPATLPVIRCGTGRCTNNLIIS